ncbi:MAG TPA: cation:proton antiporter [Candidatus Limnocylindrales bacterium]|nr:cation:proton antiporter [Candidatus Limnocylindrales bacterium]
MSEPRLLLDLVLAVLAAFAGGALAQRIGLPAIVGYLAAGLAIGPATPGPSADPESIEVLAEIGVAFLLFALGAEFSRQELRRLGRVASIGGGLQIVATMALGLGIGLAIGLSVREGLFLGAILALSSTVVALKVLLARGEATALHGRIALGILIAQDIAVVPLVVLLPTLAGAEFDPVGLALIAVKAAAVLVGAYVVGVRVVPRILAASDPTRSRELFLLAVVTVALGTAVVTSAIGLSFAFGAFLAGLVVAESEYRAQVIGEAVPLRDLFTSLFFVSVGMLVDPRTLLEETLLIAVLAVTVVVGKVVIVTAVVLLLGLAGSIALRAALPLAQIGEFSFVLAGLGRATGALSDDLFAAVLATAVVTIVIAPFAPRAAPAIESALRRVPLLRAPFAEPAEPDLPEEGMRRHTVICGFGRIGEELARSLEARRLPYLVIEYNPAVARAVRDRGIPVIYGDAGNPVVLEHAGIEEAIVVAVLVPDAQTAERAVRNARRVSTRVDIVARANSYREIERLRKAGASDVVQPEFEAGVEIIRHTLGRYGIGGLELSHLAAGRRQSFYRRDESDPH